MNRILFFCFLTCTLFSCTPENTLAPEEGEEYSGGKATVFDISSNAFSLQTPDLSNEQSLQFFVGNSFFNQNWITAPSSTAARDGLGPFFNSRACSGCHFKDGRGRPPEFSGEKGTGFLIRLSVAGNLVNGELAGDPSYGGQIQDVAIDGIEQEADVEITYSEIPGIFPDGESYSLRSPQYSFQNMAYGDFAAGILFSPRVAQQMIGLGLLEAVDEQTLLYHVDVNDADGDDISGRPNYVWDKQSSNYKLGRFGWKANQPTLLQQSAGAFNGDMGITTFLFPQENCTGAQPACESATNGGSPEIADDDLMKVVLYASNLAVPARRNWDNMDVLKGKELFNTIGCGGCHLPTLTTGSHPEFSPLSYQIIRPYTDLLLHDMGEGLADNRPDFQASGKEWRTQPLWGIGLIETVNNHTYLLHDGRARNIQEAILWHGGEAEQSKNKFTQLKNAERELVIKFLQSL